MAEAEASTTTTVQAVNKKDTDSHSKDHPLLQEDVLDKIFPHFSDPNNLGSFRLVCPTWNTSAGRTVKKNWCWIIGSKLYYGEKEFMDVMSNCTDDIFGNFLWTHEKPPYMKLRLFGTRRRHPLKETWHEHVPSFLETFGARIVNLRLRAADPVFLQRRLQSLYLPNLEHLELYDISEAVMRAESFEQPHCFPKLKSICFTHKKFHNKKEMRRFELGVGKKGSICDQILGAAPELKHLEVNIHTINRRLLIENDAINLSRLANLTSFKIAPPKLCYCKKYPETNAEGRPSLVALNRVELENLLTRCPLLKSLCLSINREYIEEDGICEVFTKSHISTQLEELHLTVLDGWTEFRHPDDFMKDFDFRLADPDADDSSPSPSSVSSSSAESDGEAELNAAGGSADLKKKRERVRENPKEVPPSKKRKTPKKQVKQPMYYVTKKPKPQTLYPVPEMPKLRKITLHFWCLHDFDIFYNKPNLVQVDLLLGDSYRSHYPICPDASRGENKNVKYLKFRDRDHVGLGKQGIKFYAAVFPNLEELDVKTSGHYEELKTIIKRMPQLRRLNLSDSKITDSGITGIGKKKLKEASEQSLTLEQVSGSNWRQKSFIGDLKELQQFTYTGQNLTNLSIRYGISALKNLTNLKFMTRRYTELTSSNDSDEEDSTPVSTSSLDDSSSDEMDSGNSGSVEFLIKCKEPLHLQSPLEISSSDDSDEEDLEDPDEQDWDRDPREDSVNRDEDPKSDAMSRDKDRRSNEPVDIRPLLTNCKHLVRLDVNRYFSDDESENYNNDSDSDVEEEPPTKTEYEGCGLNWQNINLVKETWPHLELVYGEREPPTQ